MDLFSVAVIGVAAFMGFLVLAVREHDRQERIAEQRRKARFLDRDVRQITERSRH